MTNKRFVKVISVFMLIMMISTSVLAAPVKVMVENNYLEMPVNPIIKNGRTLVPLRAIFESLGAEVDWNQKNQTVTGKLDNSTIILQINNKKASVNGNEVILDVPAEILNGSTLVPVRFVGESLGAEVDYKDGTVLINSKTVNKPPVTTHNHPQHKVIRVVDGDTIIIDYHGKEERVRLIGMDTPESVHPDSNKNIAEGKIASDYVKNMIEGKNVGIEFDTEKRDQYGRLLAYVHVGDMMLNKHLLEKGYARLSTFPPNVKYVEDFTHCQATAREGHHGFWKDGVHANQHNNQHKEGQRKTSGEFVGSIQSDKFHAPGCRWHKNIKDYNETWFSSRDDAINQGYTPCGTCNP